MALRSHRRRSFRVLKLAPHIISDCLLAQQVKQSAPQRLLKDPAVVRLITETLSELLSQELSAAKLDAEVTLTEVELHLPGPKDPLDLGAGDKPAGMVGGPGTFVG